MDVAAWLHELGLERYATAFRDAEITPEALPELTDADLRELGLPLGPRKVLLKAIQALAGPPPPPVGMQEEAAPWRAPTAPSQAERRQLTVMFVDLVGSTALSTRLDPEEMREVIQAYQAAVAAEIARLDGHVAKFMGDGVLAYFGWPAAHEDEPERAVRAGLAATAAVARLHAPGGEALAARVGIATGLVVVGDLVGDGAAQEEAVVGDTPNLAARLQALAEPGTVVVAEATRRLLGGLFAFLDLGASVLKGFAAPVCAFAVAGEATAEGRFEARHAAGSLTPLVGREQELALLLDRWERAKEGEGQVVLLSGDAGIGKSRLVRALRERLGGEPHTLLAQFCSPHHTHTALHPVIGLLERAAALRCEDPAESQLGKLEAMLALAVGDVREGATLFADLLGISTAGRYPPLDISPQQRKERTFRALLDQLAGLAARTPVLALYEDVHWADPTTLELLGRVVEQVQRLPVLALVTFRPGFAPPWAGHGHVAALSLSRLGRRQGGAMVERVTGGRTLPAEVMDQILARTDGVPLFVEELTKAVLESGLLAEREDHYELAGPLPPLAIPSTLRDSLTARLDRLAPVKEVAQIAACIGREFSHELIAAVAALPAPELDRSLVELTAAELVFSRGTAPDATYSFKHALVRDAAYGTLLRGRRRQLHARIAAALEEHFPATAETRPELLAYHCTEAGLAREAIAYWHKAARRAMAQAAAVEAVAQLERGLELLDGLPAGPERDRAELDLRIVLGGAFIAVKGWAMPEVGRTYQRARELCTGEDPFPELQAALSGLFVHHLHGSGAHVACGIAEEVLRLAERRQDRVTLAAGHRLLGVGSMFIGRLGTALEHYERALTLYDPADRDAPVHLWAPDIRVTCPSFIGLVLLWQGYPDRAVERGREGLAAAYELGHAYGVSQALFLNCWLHRARGDARMVLERAAELVPLATEHGFLSWSSGGRVMRGWVLAAEGEVAEGIADMKEGLAAYRATGALLGQPQFLGLLADTHARAGERSEALRLLAEALAIVNRMEERWFEAELHRLKGEALLLGDARDASVAEACLHKAVDVARGQGAKHWELRAATSLARIWAGRGQRREAHDLLAPVYGWFTEGFDTPDLRQARALLDQLASAPHGLRSTRDQFGQADGPR